MTAKDKIDELLDECSELGEKIRNEKALDPAAKFYNKMIQKDPLTVEGLTELKVLLEGLLTK
jgi:hypothetical protein